MDGGLTGRKSGAGRARKGRRAARGFSLVEMAIATLLIAMFMTLGLSALNVQQETAAASTTQKNLDTIKDALVNYLRTNSHLPCPSDFKDQETGSTLLAGEERRTTTSGTGVPDKATNCNVQDMVTSLPAFGILPYRALGLTREAALDGWGNFYSYHVSFISTATSPNSNDWTRSRAFLSTGNAGGLTIKESASSTNNLTTTAVVVVLSHGRNGLGAWTTKNTRITLPDQMVGSPSVKSDEFENATNGTDTTTIYVRRTRTDNESATGGSFDDYVVYLSDSDLLTQLVKDGTVKWANLTALEDMEKIRDALIGYASSTSNGTRYNPTCTTNGATTPYCKQLPYADTNSTCDGSGDTNGVAGCVPVTNLGLPSNLLLDPWGRYYSYELGDSSLVTVTNRRRLAETGSGDGIGTSTTTTCPAGAAAFRISSDGPSTSTTADNITLVYGCSELRAAIIGKIP